MFTNFIAQCLQDFSEDPQKAQGLVGRQQHPARGLWASWTLGTEVFNLRNIIHSTKIFKRKKDTGIVVELLKNH